MRHNAFLTEGRIKLTVEDLAVETVLFFFGHAFDVVKLFCVPRSTVTIGITTTPTDVTKIFVKIRIG
jgi:hypothetical protein